MITKLQRRKRNTTGFLKTFFNDFWNFVIDNSIKYPEFKTRQSDSPEYNQLVNDYDLIGKVCLCSLFLESIFCEVICKIIYVKFRYLLLFPRTTSTFNIWWPRFGRLWMIVFSKSECWSFSASTPCDNRVYQWMMSTQFSAPKLWAMSSRAGEIWPRFEFLL